MTSANTVDHYVSFLRARAKAQRAIGKYLVDAALNPFRIDVIHGCSVASLSDDAFTIKGLDITVLSAMALSGARREKMAAAMAAVRDRWPNAR